MNNFRKVQILLRNFDEGNYDMCYYIGTYSKHANIKHQNQFYYNRKSQKCHLIRANKNRNDSIVPITRFQ